MLLSIVKKEILENIFSYRFPLFFLICTILLPVGIYVNYVVYSKRVSDYHEQQRLTRDALSSSQMWDVLSGTVPLKGFRPPSSLSVFAQGFEGSLSQYYEFKQDGFRPGNNSLDEESILSITGKLDFLFILQMVLGLIVMLFAADLVSGEKELGTLRGILSNSIPRDTVLLGKFLGGYIALWIPFAFAFLGGTFVLALSSYPIYDADMLLRIVFVFLSATIFMLTYFTIGIMISCSTARTRTSLITILVVWTFLQLIVPKVSDMVATLVYPIRTATVVSMEKSLIVKNIENEKSKALGRRYEEIFGRGASLSSKPEPSPKQDEWNAFKKEIEQMYQERKAKELAMIDDAYANEKQIQQNIATSFSLISPSAAFAHFITDICGTGESDRRKYAEAVKGHQHILDRELFSHVKRTTLIFPGGGSAATISVEKVVDLRTLPNFSISQTELSEILRGNLYCLISLTFWLIAPFAVAYVRFLKYDVR